MSEDMRKWECEQGVEFLRKVGAEPGHQVMDLGARVGHYAIPAAKAVGPFGRVYAIDKDHTALDELQRKAKAQALSNIRIMKTCGQLKVDLAAASVDLVLLYDVLHYFEKNDRRRLYREIARLLKPGGIVSVYPKHTLEDHPSMELQAVTLEQVTREIEMSGFFFKNKCCGTVSHNDGLDQGCVLNFVKGRADDRRVRQHGGKPSGNRA